MLETNLQVADSSKQPHTKVHFGRSLHDSTTQSRKNNNETVVTLKWWQSLYNAARDDV